MTTSSSPPVMTDPYCTVHGVFMDGTFSANYCTCPDPSPPSTPETELRETLRIVDVDDFGDRKLEFGGSWNEMLVRVFDAASSDENGRAVILPETEFLRLRAPASVPTDDTITLMAKTVAEVIGKRQGREFEGWGMWADLLRGAIPTTNELSTSRKSIVGASSELREALLAFDAACAKVYGEDTGYTERREARSAVEKLFAEKEAEIERREEALEMFRENRSMLESDISRLRESVPEIAARFSAISEEEK